MIKKLRILIIFSLLLNNIASAQPCTTLGQNPSTAFPVCGTTVFQQNSVPICSSHAGDLAVPGCGSGYPSKNPFWYKFTCFQSGTLNFTITPINPGDDYDWQLYDVTGRDPNEVFTNASLVVTGNWSGTFGATGASPTGVTFIQCASDPSTNEPSFARSPNLIAGHQYILLVSHFTDSQSGYSLSFNGGTAVITDPKLPALFNGEAACDGTEIRVRLNKKMKCNSLSLNGSDFRINSTLTAIIAAAATQCSNNFDMDSLTLTLNNPLPPGTYKVYAKRGMDGNTLLDNCDREVNVDDSIQFTVYPLIPTPMDSISKVGCSPQVLELVFRKPLQCSSIEPRGTDFTVSGPVPVTVSGAAGNCVGGLSTTIQVQLSAPLQVGGTYSIRLQNGTDGNTILDECGQQTPAGSTLTFTVKDTVNAGFSYSLVYACDKNTVQYNHDGRNGINSYTWNFDNTSSSNLPNPVVVYTDFEPKHTRLVVSNGTCSDTAETTLVFDNLLKADFEITNLVCPGDSALIKNNTIGNGISSWNWTFGNGGNSTLKDPPAQVYPIGTTNYNQAVLLTVRNNYGCEDTATRYVRVINNCYIAVPSAFTPNGDGLNDYLYPLNAYKAVNLNFSVYNRFGQRIFETRDWTNKWDGRFKGQGADPGTYVWVLTYIHTDTNRRVEQKGTTILIR